MVRHNLSLSRDVGWGQMRELECLRLDPTQRLQVLEEEVIAWELCRQLNTVIVPTLRNPYDRLDLLDLLVVRRGHAIQVGSDLCPEIRSGDERAQNILREDVGE